MAIRRKYRLKKRIKNFLIFYAFTCILFTASYTLSRYVEKASGISDINIAKFNVKVNDINVMSDIPIQINFSSSKTYVSEKIAPNSEGYFAFTIDPTGTEVSLEYELIFRLDDTINTSNDFKLLYFTINDEPTHYDIINENTIEKDLLLKTNTHGFTKEDQINLKVYWSWDKKEDIINEDINNYENKNINVIAIVKQKIK